MSKRVLLVSVPKPMWVINGIQNSRVSATPDVLRIYFNDSQRIIHGRDRFIETARARVFEYRFPRPKFGFPSARGRNVYADRVKTAVNYSCGATRTSVSRNTRALRIELGAVNSVSSGRTNSHTSAGTSRVDVRPHAMPTPFRFLTFWGITF